jgi:hypothetical protein
LTAGQSTSFTVSFDPSSVGLKDASVRIPHSDLSQATPLLVPVLGDATAASDSSDDDDEEEESCSSGTGRGMSVWAMLMPAVAILVWRNSRRRRVVDERRSQS